MTTIGPIKALGTIWYVECFDVCDAALVRRETQAFLEAFEARYSRFRPDSLVSQLNHTGQLDNPPVEFVTLLERALTAYDDTDGVFNVLVGEQLEQIGYDQTYSLTAQGDSTAPPAPPAALSISPARIELSAGKLDLGGIGKGFAIDGLATYLETTLGIKHFLINGGGDVYVTSDQGQPVKIALAHPQYSNQQIGTVSLREQGFAASSPFLRQWTDPKTGQAHNHLLSDTAVASYVVAPSATWADVWATTLSVGSKRGLPICTHALVLQEDRILMHDPLFSLNT